TRRGRVGRVPTRSDFKNYLAAFAKSNFRRINDARAGVSRNRDSVYKDEKRLGEVHLQQRLWCGKLKYLPPPKPPVKPALAKFKKARLGCGGYFLSGLCFGFPGRAARFFGSASGNGANIVGGVSVRCWRQHGEQHVQPCALVEREYRCGHFIN